MLRCPRCSAAFVDFDGCLALTCYRCRGAFCGLCLMDCGADAHQHVQSCNSHHGYFMTALDWEAFQKKRRLKALKAYLDTDVPQNLREKVRDRVSVHLA
mmetsp:Transcript_75679/g.204365  ORF Transcript_75679/g.204365 Transcript_75679/m.204365 type:complete len:99 (+) Transcript_75679:595-891(+)